MDHTNVTSEGARYSVAMRGLNFYREEIKILELRLYEIASKSSSFEARQGIEHFQNQFVIQQNNIHDLKHKFNDLIHLMSLEAIANDGRINQEENDTEKKLLDDYALLEKVVNELRHEFNVFLSKWM